MSAITLTELNYDATTPGDGAEVAAYLRTGTEALLSTSGALHTLVQNGAGAGAVNIQDGGNSITVDALDLDIRDLDFATDSVDVSGSAVTATVTATDLDIRDLVFATDKVDVSGSEVSLDTATLAALESITVQNGAGAAAVNIQDGGNSITVDAVDLDIRDLSSATDSVAILSNFEYAEDSAHASGSIGIMPLAVRNDAGTPLAADGDYIPFTTDATGALRVAGTISVTEQDVYAEDSAHVSGDLGGYVLNVREDVYASSTSASGDYQSFKSDLFGRLYTVDSANSSMANGSASVSTTALLVAANAGRRRILVQNLGNKKVYLGASGVTTGNGIMLASAGSVELELGPALALHAVAESGTQDVRYLQLA